MPRVTIEDKLSGERLREIRNQIGLSRRVLAKKLNISTNALKKYELGECRMSGGRLTDICNLLGLDIDGFYKQDTEQHLTLIKYFLDCSPEAKKTILELAQRLALNG